LAYAAGEDDPTPLVADIFPAHKRIGYDKKTAVKIMDDDNRDILIDTDESRMYFNITLLSKPFNILDNSSTILPVILRIWAMFDLWTIKAPLRIPELPPVPLRRKICPR
jgi:hypothetical protein